MKMRICIFSPNFFPMVGGLENVVADISDGLVGLGCQVDLITLTSAGEALDNFTFNVHRKPGLVRALKVASRADIFVMFNVSLKGFPLWLLSGKPLVISHQGLNPPSIRAFIKNFIANKIAHKNIGCSQYVARHFVNSVGIGNCYNDKIFYKTSEWSERKYDLVFLGRLVSDKGADIFLKAIGILKERGFEVTGSIIGNGPELPDLLQLQQILELDKEVNFLGIKTGQELVTCLNEHKLMIVPSIWEEPFGIVALEGMACGCLVIGSKGGGLSEAIGKGGLTFENGNVLALVQQIESVIFNDSLRLECESNYEAHLHKHLKMQVAQSYLQVFEGVTK